MPSLDDAVSMTKDLIGAVDLLAPNPSERKADVKNKVIEMQGLLLSLVRDAGRRDGLLSPGPVAPDPDLLAAPDPDLVALRMAIDVALCELTGEMPWCKKVSAGYDRDRWSARAAVILTSARRTMCRLLGDDWGVPDGFQQEGFWTPPYYSRRV